MNNKKHLIIIGYIVGIVLSIGGCIFLAAEIKLLCIIGFGIFLNQLLKSNTNIDAAPSLFVTLFIIFIVSLAFVFFSKKQIKKEFNEYGSVVTIAVIDNIYNYRLNHSIDFHYKTLSDITVRVNNICGEEISKAKSISDTILIRYSRLSHNKYKVFNYFPTHEEIQKYRNGVLYEPKKSEEE
ncbi:MAG: hypothetical protein J6W13_11095 [Salinivirgaceae bacterium]|nr:hypothetical protein [Salinivirgaceae bacterium]